jgi:soluble lytic murein transglycosylase
MGSFLLLCGLWSVAQTYLARFEMEFPQNLLLQFDLAMLYHQTNSPVDAFRVSRRLSWRIPEACRLRMPLPIYTALYPPFYAPILLSEAQRYEVDPSLIWAVMRQESVFDPKIESPAGAIGLMQIMPYTAKEIAQDLNEPYIKDSLYSPLTNLRYGTFYLRQLLKQFDGNLVLALASYNGGPHNAKRWHERNKDSSLDVFIESIEFTETRDYVKKVLANYWTYQAIASRK